MESPAFKEKLKLHNKDKKYQWKDKEKEQDTVLWERIIDAKNQRRQSFRRFDDLTFEQDYNANEDVVNAYLRPKKNDDEVRIVTGTTEKKVEVAVNEMLSYNFQHEIYAHDKDDLELTELGSSFADLVTRTNEMENDDDVKCDALFEFCGQRAVFFEEYLEEKNTNGTISRKCRKRLLSGLQVFLGDITLPHYRFNEQPFIVKYDKMNYWTAKMFYGHKKNWEYVMPGEMADDDWYGGEFNLRMARLDDMEVEIVRYESAGDNEFQMWINKVPMEEFGTKLPWKHEGYNTVMGVVKRLSSTMAYGRCPVASLKYLQGLKDEVIRNLVRKFRQAVEPPKGAQSTGKVYSKDIFQSGKITYGIAKDSLHNLVDHTGITPADTDMLEIIDRLANEFASSSAIQQGIQEQRKETATAIVEARKQAVKMLGLVIFGWTRVIKELTYLRIYNILENFTEPNGKDIDALTQEVVDTYSRFTLKDATLNNEKQGKKVISFTDKNLTEEEEDGLLEYEEEQDAIGKPVQVTYVNAKLLREIPVKWFVVVTPKEKEDSALHRLMFADKFRQGVELSQVIMEPLNPGKWKQEYEQTWKTKDAFIKEQPQQIDENGQPVQPGGMGDMGAQMAAGSKAQAKKPSMTAMLNA